MSEQFGIDRSFGNGAAVHGDIFIVFTCRIGMDHLREKLLADAAFTRNEYRKIGRRHTQGNLQRTIERLGVADDPETVFMDVRSVIPTLSILFYSQYRQTIPESYPERTPHPRPFRQPRAPARQVRVVRGIRAPDARSSPGVDNRKR